MIINGGGRGNVGYWSSHLTNTEQNERAELKETRGLSADNLPDALREMEAISKGSRSKGNFMYVADISPRADERLTEEQWKEAVDTLENHLGLSGHQRIVMEHEKEGRTHRHVVWNRVDVETLRVKDIGGNFYTHERVARDLEIKFDLQRGQSLHGEHRPEGRPDRAPELSEIRAAEKTGIDTKEIKAELTDLWCKTDSGKAFAAALDESGYILAKGDRRSFVVVDHAGTVHSLAKRIEGVKTKEIRERLSDLDYSSLPTVKDAQATQHEKYPTREDALEGWKLSQDRLRNMAGRYDPLRPEAEPQRRDERPEAKHPSYAPEREPEQPQQQEPPEKAPKGEKWHNRDATKLEEKIFHIQDAATRGGASVAAGLYAEGITLARVDAKGKADMDAEYRTQFDFEKAKGNDGAWLRRAAFAEGELVAVNEWGNVSRINPRFIDLEKLEHDATGGMTPALSAAREFFADVRQQQKQDRQAEQHGRYEQYEAQPDKATPDAKGDDGIKVINFKGATESLSNFLEGLLGMGTKRPPMSEQEQQAQAIEALERIADSIERGDRLNASDVANLLPEQLFNLHRHGDDIMREMIDDLRSQQKQERERDWERER